VLVGGDAAIDAEPTGTDGLDQLQDMFPGEILPRHG